MKSEHDVDCKFLSPRCYYPPETPQGHSYSKSLVRLPRKIPHNLLPDLSDFGLERPSSTSIRSPRAEFEFVNYCHPSEAQIPQNRKRVRSLISKKQHQREKSLACFIRSQATQEKDTVEVQSLQRLDLTAVSAGEPVHTRILNQSETTLDCQPGKDQHDLIDFEHINVSALRWYAYSFESRVNLLAARGRQSKLTSI